PSAAKIDTVGGDTLSSTAKVYSPAGKFTLPHFTALEIVNFPATTGVAPACTGNAKDEIKDSIKT
ncbi:MAG: hypothetical protein WA823_07210, partial [Candidatus Acidiferrales bacterium]